LTFGTQLKILIVFEAYRLFLCNDLFRTVDNSIEEVGCLFKRQVWISWIPQSKIILNLDFDTQLKILIVFEAF